MSGVGRIGVAERPHDVPPGVDGQIAALAARQHGSVAARQLAALGLGKRAISRRVAAGRLHVVHRGVYAVGHPLLSRHGHWMAAVLACGPGAALSHASAGALWEIRFDAAARTDVSVPRSGSRDRDGIRIHRPRSLPADEVTAHRAIPVTTPARTLLDLAATLPTRKLHRALDQTEILRLTDRRSLAALARAHPGHRGAGHLSRALHDHCAGTTLTRSELEERFLELCVARGLPRPRVNAIAEGLEVDFLFAGQRLVVETDGWQYHRTRTAFERDRHRDATLTRAGYRTLRFTHHQLTTDPTTVAATVTAALA